MRTLNVLKIALLISTVTFFTSCDRDDSVEDTLTTTHNVDLEVSDITFSVVDNGNFEGVATITGVVTNIGADDFISSPGQQAVSLFENNTGLPSSQAIDLVAEVPFTELGAGESIIVTYSRPWNASSPAEGEFPPMYTVVANLDPDLQIDGNDMNNDASASNNAMSKSGSEINEMF